MVRFRELAGYLRKMREAKGLRSAAALARKAGLSLNYISIVERGELRPKWQTLRRIADALELDPSEREEFFRIADSSGKPREVQEATTGFGVPGLALWRHLPGLLFRVEHDEARTDYPDPDQQFVSAVRSAGSLLAWVSLLHDPPSAQQCEQLAESLRLQFRAEAGIEPEAFVLITQAIPVLVPQLWRAMLYREKKTTERLVKLFSAWTFLPGNWSDRPDLITFQFADRKLDECCAVRGIEPHEVVYVHDALIFAWFLSRFSAAEYAGIEFVAPFSNPYLRKTTLCRKISELIVPAEDEVRKAITSDSTPGRVPTHGWETLANYSRFAARIFLDERVAPLVLGEDWEALRDRMIARCLLVEEILQDVDQRTPNGRWTPPTPE